MQYWNEVTHENERKVSVREPHMRLFVGACLFTYFAPFAMHRLDSLVQTCTNSSRRVTVIVVYVSGKGTRNTIPVFIG